MNLKNNKSDYLCHNIHVQIYTDLIFSLDELGLHTWNIQKILVGEDIKVAERRETSLTESCDERPKVRSLDTQVKITRDVKNGM